MSSVVIGVYLAVSTIVKLPSLRELLSRTTIDIVSTNWSRSLFPIADNVESLTIYNL